MVPALTPRPDASTTSARSVQREEVEPSERWPPQTRGDRGVGFLGLAHAPAADVRGIRLSCVALVFLTGKAHEASGGRLAFRRERFSRGGPRDLLAPPGVPGQ